MRYYEPRLRQRATKRWSSRRPDGPGCTSMSAASESVVEAAAAVVEATGVRGRHEVDSRVGHQVGLEFGECRR